MFQGDRRVLAISIHALTRSATRATALETSKEQYFNPRTHEECDVMIGALTAIG